MKRNLPDGPHITFPLAVIGQLFPSFFPFDPLSWGLDIARRYGDTAYYRAGPLQVFQFEPSRSRT